jgi:hypothetical protein
MYKFSVVYEQAFWEIWYALFEFDMKFGLYWTDMNKNNFDSFYMIKI